MGSTLTIWHWLIIGAGGGLGAMARFATVSWLNKWHGSAFPWGTFSVNVVGSFIMGLAFVLFTIKYPQLPGSWRSFVMVGASVPLSTSTETSL